MFAALVLDELLRKVRADPALETGERLTGRMMKALFVVKKCRKNTIFRW
jgi:hypothetical protein